jgi:quercetin dioxygenase-like cupin family protein
MEFLTDRDIVRFSNPGIVSEQLLSPHNSASTRVTITRVTVQPGASQPRHTHDRSEQIWIALQGRGLLKLAGGETRPIEAGEIARFPDGCVHGFRNTGTESFVYIAVTTPPINFDYAYGIAGGLASVLFTWTSPPSWQPIEFWWHAALALG